MNTGEPGLGTILAVAGPGTTPIEVLQESGASRPIRGMSGEPLQLPEGLYWVQAVLPGLLGRSQTTDAQLVKVDAGQQTPVQFEVGMAVLSEQRAPATAVPAAAAAPSPPAAAPPLPFSGAPMPAALSLLAPKTAFLAPLSGMLGVIAGAIGPAASLLRSGFAAIQAVPPRPDLPVPADPPLEPPRPALPSCNVNGSEPVMVAADLPLLCIRGPRRQWLAPIPTVPGQLTAVTTALALDTDEPAPFPCVKLHFADPNLDRLWQFANTRAMTDARATALALIRNPTALPTTTAALACYVLLRVQWDEDLLHFVAAQLEADPDAPDLWAIQAELLSRLGRHDQAAQSLARLGQGRCRWPFFRPGIEYARQRARRLIPWEGSPGLPNITTVLSGLTVICESMNPDPLSLVLRTPDALATAQILYPPVITPPATPKPPPLSPPPPSPPG